MSTKKFFLFLFVTIITASPLIAGHTMGGEITWNCLGNGQYQFHMSFYRDCSSVPWIFQNETIDIVGTPLPSNGISSIVMEPDQTSFMLRNGETAPECSNQYGTALSCANGDFGIVQRFQYISDSISLTGVPPASGWSFIWEGPCCRSSLIENIPSSGGKGLLRAMMFPTINNNLVDTCYDSSPHFADLPQTVLCRGQVQRYNHVVQDLDGDSLVHKWGRPINSPIVSPANHPYNNGYSLSNPTPDVSFDARNLPSTINSETGDIRFAVYNNTGTKLYTKVVETESWRNGKMIAKIAREIPFVVADCPALPSSYGNDVPILFITSFLKGYLASGADGVVRDTVVAGSDLNYIINVIDSDTTGVGTGIQPITLVPFGQNFSLDFTDSSFCSNPGDSSCVVLSPAPIYNATLDQYELNGTAVGTQFNWKTNCSHLKNDSTALTHYFYFKFLDDHCPVPSIGYQTFAVTILPSKQPCSLLTGIAGAGQGSNFQQSIQLYPNPTEGMLSIRTKEPMEKITLSVRDIQGQLIEEEYFPQLNQSDFLLKGSPGIYFLEIRDNKGDKVFRKVVKK